MPEPFGEHGDLTYIVGNEVGSPLKEVLWHDFELFLEKSSVSKAHFISVALERPNVKLPPVVINGELFTILNLPHKRWFGRDEIKGVFVAGASLDSVSRDRG